MGFLRVQARGLVSRMLSRSAPRWPSAVNRLRITLDRGVTMASLADRLADAHGGRGAVRLEAPVRFLGFEGAELSFTDLADLAARAHGALRAAGVRRGERVAVATGNRIEFLLVTLGAIRLGAVAVPLNHLLAPPEMGSAMEDSGAKTVVVDREVGRRLKGRLPRGARRRLSIEPVPGFRTLDPPGQAPLPAKIAPKSPVAIFYTSGTTGHPKGALLTSEGLLSGMRGAALYPGLAEDDLALGVLPLAHIMGFCALLMAFIAGVPVLFLGKFDAGTVLRKIEEERVTLFVGVPAMYALMLQAGAEKRDLSSVRLWASAADAMPASHVKKFVEMGARATLGRRSIPRCVFTEAYGMVELSGPAFVKVNWPGVDLEPGCIGWPLYPVRAKIAGSDGRGEARRGEVGELCIRGPGVARGYVGRRAPVEEGWLRTGDLARVGRWGLFYFVDRKKDVIKCGGYSVFSAEVEEALLGHPAVADCAVVGVPHPAKGEMPVAAVTLRRGARATEAQLMAWAKDRLAAYKAPRRVHVLREHEMPYGPTKKILKRELKERFKGDFSGAQ
ncbi:MAG: AMP-binding protein [Halobacteria archaeon]